MRPDKEQARIHRAEAEQLRQDPAFQRAVLDTRKFCLEQMATVDPLDTEKIRKIQATIFAIDMLSETLADTIIRGHEPRVVSVA